MKKVIIIGATGSLASVVIKELEKQKDVELTLFVRNKNRLSNTKDVLIIEGDAMNYNDVKSAITGQDIVYINLAGDLETMTSNIVKAMQENNVKRVIGISSIGIYDKPLKPILKPYRASADIIEVSGLDYTIIRPDWFTSGNETDYRITVKPEPETVSAVSRKSIAAFVSSIIENPDSYSQHNVGISKG